MTSSRLVSVNAEGKRQADECNWSRNNIDGERTHLTQRPWLSMQRDPFQEKRQCIQGYHGKGFFWTWERTVCKHKGQTMTTPRPQTGIQLSTKTGYIYKCTYKKTTILQPSWHSKTNNWQGLEQDNSLPWSPPTHPNTIKSISHVTFVAGKKNQKTKTKLGSRTSPAGKLWLKSMSWGGT